MHISVCACVAVVVLMVGGGWRCGAVVVGTLGRVCEHSRRGSVKSAAVQRQSFAGPAFVSTHFSGSSNGTPTRLALLLLLLLVGWIALYIPSAYMLVEGGTFYKGEDGLWDTPDAARFILNSVLDNHGSALKVRGVAPCTLFGVTVGVTCRAYRLGCSWRRGLGREPWCSHVLLAACGMGTTLGVALNGSAGGAGLCQ